MNISVFMDRKALRGQNNLFPGYFQVNSRPRGEWRHMGTKILRQKTCTDITKFKTMWASTKWSASVQFSLSVVSNSLQPHGLKHARLLCPSPTPGACSNSSSRWCHPTILSPVIPFSSHLQSFPASGSFSMSQLFASVATVKFSKFVGILSESFFRIWKYLAGIHHLH